MTYEQALDFWYGRVNYETRSPTPSDLNLDRMRVLLERLGNPHQQLNIVHVAGTKGKGSTSAMLASILRQSGYRVGLFTSPHLVHVEERIQIDGMPISRQELADLLGEVADAVRILDEQAEHGVVTFFEIATAVGFLHFRRSGTDYTVLEVGLGGRFDSTNVCRPLVSVITNISFDHTQQLGNTLALIAMEKAGIVKPGRPTVSGVRAAEARQVIEDICRERQSPLIQLDRDFHFQHWPARISTAGDRLTRVQTTTQQRPWPVLEVNLLGEHQAGNAAVAVATIEELQRQGFAIPDRAVAEGLQTVHWPARMEVVRREPLVVLDCAHNVASVQATLQTLRDALPLAAEGRRFLVFAASRDKDVAGMLALLAPHFAHCYLTSFGNNPRCCTPEELAALMPADSSVSLCAESTDAWKAALAGARADDVILITGSVFLAGELRPILR